MLAKAIFLVKAAIFFSDLFAPAALRTPEPPPTMINEVVDFKGKPIAGAEVTCEIVFDDGKVSQLQPVRTDAQGQFHLALPAQREFPEVVEGPQILTVSCLATAPGHRPAFDQHGSSRYYGNGWRLELDPPSPGRVKVLDPEGRPVEGAMVIPSLINDDTLLTVAMLYYRAGTDKPYSGDPWAGPTRRLIEQLAVTTDKEGMAAIVGTKLKTDARDATDVVVITPRFGRQWCRLHFSKSREEVVRLQGMGRVVGHVVAERPELTRNVRLRACSRSKVFSEVLVTTDAQGRFEIPSIAAGNLDIGPLKCGAPFPSAGPVYYLKPFVVVDVRAGTTTTVTLPYQRAVRLHGIAREKETGKPLPNTWVNCNPDWHAVGRPTDGYPDERLGIDFDFNIGSNSQTDANGRFELYTLPSTMQIRVGGIMRPRSIVVPEGVQEYELKPFEPTRIELELDRLLPNSVKEFFSGT